MRRRCAASPQNEGFHSGQRSGDRAGRGATGGALLAGDPDFLDHWIDIAGYAKLVVDGLGADAGREPRGRVQRA